MSNEFTVANRFNLIRSVAKPKLQNALQFSTASDIPVDKDMPGKSKGKTIVSVPQIFAIDCFEGEPILNAGENLTLHDATNYSMLSMNVTYDRQILGSSHTTTK